MIEATCHCGAVRIEVPFAPEAVTSCNCSICRRLGWLCAYYSPRSVTVQGVTDTYVQGDRTLMLHRCKTCGCITHWLPMDPALDRMAVNGRLMAPTVLATTRVRRFDGADSWTFLDEDPKP